MRIAPSRAWVLACAVALAAATPPTAARAAGEAEQFEPSIGYAFPAGGRQGTVVRVDLGGQNLQNVSEAVVSGTGVRAVVQRWLPAWRQGILDGDQSRELMRQLREIRSARRGATAGSGASLPRRREDPAAPPAEPEERARLPDHPLLKDLASQTDEQLQEVVDYFFRPRNLQQLKRAIGEAVRLEVTIDPDAAPGPRDLRLGTPRGFTNPVRFEIGIWPEFVEKEPNDPVGPEDAAPGRGGALLARAAALTGRSTEAKPPPVLEPPVVINGQLMPKDLDQFRFRARRGQSLVVEVGARRLVPYQADSVPGWMQAVVTVRDEKGRELAYADDFRFDPDPVLCFRVPEDGEYLLDVGDAIYRGREDFVYRVTVVERPFVTHLYPLGGTEGAPQVATASGWNLPWERVRLSTEPGGGRLREVSWQVGDAPSNTVRYAVDDLPETEEAEPNDGLDEAQAIQLPRIVNGRIGRSGDVDVFRFDGHGGEEVVVDVDARVLGSPIDSLVRLTDASGKVVAWNDDFEDRGQGLMTHHADSHLRAKLPSGGAYFVRLSDAQWHGGEEYAYRLRVSPRRPDFELRVTPSSVNVASGRTAVLTVHAMRRDGFDGDIALSLDGAPEGFVLGGGTIPGARDKVRVTLTAPGDPPRKPVVLSLVGKAKAGSATLVRVAVPAEDVMQAFAYRHLVPARELIVSVLGPARRGPSVEQADVGRVRVPMGGTGTARFKLPAKLPMRDVRFELADPPKGVSLGAVKPLGDSLVLEIKTDGKVVEPGLADNLIVEAYNETSAGKGDDGKERRRRTWLGVLPAIPFEVFRR